jgi:hypothetical protein
MRMPLVYRAMKKDADDLPTIEASASGLGVRPGLDIDVDAQGHAIANGKGMSVAPAWRVMPVWRIPKRLRDKRAGARGPNNIYCFRTGTGPFQRDAFAKGLELVPDSTTHGCIAPTQTVVLTTYEGDLELTRANWQIDES